MTNERRATVFFLKKFFLKYENLCFVLGCGVTIKA